GFAGLISEGTVRPGDAIRVVPSGRTSTVARIVTLDGDLDEAVVGQSVTLTLADEIDCSRGDVLAAADAPPQAADQFEATLVWMSHFALRRAQNVHWQALEVSRSAHAALKGQKPVVVWFTGLSGSGKSTIANLVEKQLHAAGKHTFLLDGDNVRHGLNKDLGF